MQRRERPRRAASSAASQTSESTSLRDGRRRSKRKAPLSTTIDSVQPKPKDVILGRGKGASNHPGNQNLHRVVEDQVISFRNEKRASRGAVVRSVVERICKKGRFLKFDEEGGGWSVVSENAAAEKVDQAFRYRMRQEESKVQLEDSKPAAKKKSPSPEGGLSGDFELEFPEPFDQQQLLASTLLETPPGSSSSPLPHKGTDSDEKSQVN